MANLTYDSSIFTRVDKWDSDYSYKGILLADKINQKNGQNYKLLDAIDIDWNGMWAACASTYVYDTKDLLDVLTYIDPAERFFETNSKLTEIENSYVDKNIFQDLISQLQNALSPGEFITINEDSVISTYGLVSYTGLADVLDSYTTLSYLYEYAYDKVGTVAAINDKINEIIGEANESFNTIKEISDWIMNQSTYDPVEYEDIDFSNGKRYFIFVDGEYIEVDEAYVEEHTDDQYYVLHTLREDVESLDNRISYAESTIGYVLYENGSYTYSGMMLSLHELEESTEYLNDKVDALGESVIHLSQTVSSFIPIINNAVQVSNEAYSMAYDAYNIAVSEIAYCESAYAMAYYAYVEVGFEATETHYRKLTDEEIEQLANGTLTIPNTCYKDEEGHYVMRNYTTSISAEWYERIEGTPATGMHKRIDDLSYEVDTSLYRLAIDNSYAMSYVYLTISPYEYNGQKERTIKMHSTEAYISLNEGIIKSDGIITASSVNSIIGYVVEWVDLPCLEHD